MLLFALLEAPSLYYFVTDCLNLCKEGLSGGTADIMRSSLLANAKRCHSVVARIGKEL